MEALEDHDDTQERLVQLRRRREGNRGLAGVRIFGIDPGSVRTGYGCVETNGTRHRLVTCGVLSAPGRRQLSADGSTFIHDGLARLLETAAPECVVDREPVSRAQRAERADARPRARRRRARRGRSRACRSSNTRRPKSSWRSSATAAPRKRRCSRWSSCCSASTRVPSPHDAADALAVAICHAHVRRGARDGRRGRQPRHLAELAHAKLPDARRRPGAVIAHLPGTLLEKQRPAARRRRRRRRLRRAGAALDVLRASASRDRASRCASTRTCARTRCSCSGLRTRARALALSSG